MSKLTPEQKKYNERNNENQKWKPCPKCGGRIWSHRPESHICEVKK